jgi:uncharacterized membrane protein
MDKGRLEAFSDGVIAIIITIMVLEMKVPLPHQGATLADLKPVLPYFLSYVLSYVFIGIYWNNHHHLFQATRRVTGGVLWANLHLLFWLSIIPFTTAWMGENEFAPTPTAVYGVVLLLAALAYHVLQLCILRAPGGNPVLEEALGNDWKGKISPVLYLLAIAACFVSQWLACALYVLVALIWLIPDRRIERLFANRESDD